uniref:Reverse transcriptase RNase H-like domain-containing protein n=1 Tax=Lactuca sativa TaxID=4236 RepID=A0A9R1WV08_LACSA|nr:hypothetical protein LSAT_V11C900490500 [Lactuca sativa]
MPFTNSRLPAARGDTTDVFSSFQKTITSMLAMEREGKQVPIHFVSRAQQVPEVNYLTLEKPVLALVYATRRLQRYFQAHKLPDKASVAKVGKVRAPGQVGHRISQK